MFPYEKYKSNDEWRIVENAVQALVTNQDVVITTSPDYVVGYLVKEIVEAKSEKAKF